MRRTHPPAAPVPEVAGCRPGPRQLIEGQRAPQRPLAEAWISDGLIAEAIAVASRLYRRPVNEKEAIAMLRNIRHCAETMLHIVQELPRP